MRHNGASVNFHGGRGAIALRICGIVMRRSRDLISSRDARATMGEPAGPTGVTCALRRPVWSILFGEETTVTHHIEAVYEHGLLRPLTPIAGLSERAHVMVTVEVRENGTNADDCLGMFADEPELLDQIVAEAMESRNHPLRLGRE